MQAIKGIRRALGVSAVATLALTGTLQAQVPPAIEAELVKMGRVVDPGCTGKLYRPLFDKNDYNTYWPVDAAAPNKDIKLYKGMTVMRDVSYGPQPKDLIDIFVPEKAGANRTVFIFVPGGAGNKIEQQAVESNMFYDNIGKWAADNGMIGVTIQRGGTAAGQNIALVIDHLQTNIAKYKGNPNDMFIMAHSAGTGPLTQYIGRPDLYGLGVRGAIFAGAHPAIGGGGAGGGRGGAGGPRGGAAGGGGRGGPGGPAAGGTPAATTPATCLANANVQAGPIRGPSSSLPDQGAGAAKARQDLAGSSPWRWDGKMWIATGAGAPAAPAAGGGAGGGRGARGGGAGGPGGPGGAAGGARGDAPGGARGGAGGGRGGAAPDAPAPAAPAFTTQDGFHVTRAAIALAWGELDIDAEAGKGMPSRSVAIHDELCKLDGPKAKDGVGHCPTMMWFKGESHMSEVFSFGSVDKTVSDQVLAFIKQNH